MVLRSKSPDMIRQELYALLCVYQAIYAKDATLGRDRFACLRTRRRRRRPHRKPDG